MFSRQHKSAFDDDDLKALQRVFDAVCAALRLCREDRVLRERLGAFMFEMAQSGEQNEVVLWSRAMRRFADPARVHSGLVPRAGPVMVAQRRKSRPASRL